MQTQAPDHPAARSPAIWADPAMMSAIAARDTARITRRWRKLKGVSQRELAGRLYLTQSVLSRIEHGNRPIPQLQRWAAVLDMPACLTWWDTPAMAPQADARTLSPHDPESAASLEVRRFSEGLRQIRRAAQAHGSSYARAMVERQYAWGNRLLKDHSWGVEDARSLRLSQAEVAAHLAVIHLERDDLAGADRLREQSWRIAAAGRELPAQTRLCLLDHSVRVLRRQGRLAEATRTARAMEPLAAALDSARVRSLVAYRSARLHVQSGDWPACRRALDLARERWQWQPHRPATDPFGWYSCANRIAGEACCLARMGDLDGAVRALDDLVPIVDDQRRRTWMGIVIAVAELYLAAGDRANLHRYAQKALDLLVTVASDQTDRRLRALFTRIARLTDPGSTELVDRYVESTGDPRIHTAAPGPPPWFLQPPPRRRGSIRPTPRAS